MSELAMRVFEPSTWSDQSVVMPWMIPINLRGNVRRDRDTANFTSYESVKICSHETVDDIHQQIYAVLGKGEHRANWYTYDGDWDPEKTITQAECEGGWLFAPPVLRCQLLGAGCVTFQNRLSLVN